MPKHALPLPVFVDGSGHRRVAVKLGIRSLAGALAIGIAAFLFSLGMGVPLPGLTHPVRLPPAERPPAQVDGPLAPPGSPSSSAGSGTPHQHAHRHAAVPTVVVPNAPGTTRTQAVRRPATTAPTSQPGVTAAGSSTAAASSSAPVSSAGSTPGTTPTSASTHGRAPTAPPGRTHTPGRPSERPTHP